jgi:hypothetical protein
MERIILRVICFGLVKLCDLTHMLPYRFDEFIQVEIFIRFIGYHCPFATWSAMMDEKYNLGIWEYPNGY